MKKLFVIVASCISFLAACNQNNTSENVFEKITITSEPTLLKVMYDSLDIAKAKGETEESQEEFYTGADDYVYYDGMLRERMDSLHIPVIQSDRDSILVTYPGGKFTIIKDSTFGLFEYFYFDKDTVKRADVFEMAGI